MKLWKGQGCVCSQACAAVVVVVGGGRLVSDSTIAMGGKEESFSSQGLRMPERSPLPSALPLRSCSSHLSHKYL